MCVFLYLYMSVFQTKEKSIHSCVQFQFGRQQSGVAVTTFREDCPDFFYSFNNSSFYVCTQWRFGKRHFKCRDTKSIGKSPTYKLMFKVCLLLWDSIFYTWLNPQSLSNDLRYSGLPRFQFKVTTSLKCWNGNYVVEVGWRPFWAPNYFLPCSLDSPPRAPNEWDQLDQKPWIHSTQRVFKCFYSWCEAGMEQNLYWNNSLEMCLQIVFSKVWLPVFLRSTT